MVALISVPKLGLASAVANVFQAGVKVIQILVQLFDAFLEVISPLLSSLAPRRRTVIVLKGDDLVLHDQVGRGELVCRGVLGRDFQLVPPLSGIVDLRLPADQLLRRSLILPAAGRAYLRPIIAHRLERLTPWRPDRVIHGFAVPPEDRADGSVAVDLLATSTDRLGPILERLGTLGIVPSSLGSAEDPLNFPPLIDLYAGRPGVADLRLRRIVLRMIAALIAGLTSVSIATGWLAHAAADQHVENGRRLAVLRSRLQSGGNAVPSRDRMLIEAHRGASVLLLLDSLSKSIPDNTVLREINLNQGKLRLVGRSADAPALIGHLEGKTGLTGVRFAAPVVRDAEGRDLFEIVGERSINLNKISKPDASGKRDVPGNLSRPL